MKSPRPFVANAGIAITAPLVETTVQQWAPVVENLAFVVCQCVHTELGVVYVAPARRRLGEGSDWRRRGRLSCFGGRARAPARAARTAEEGRVRVAGQEEAAQ